MAFNWKKSAIIGADILLGAYLLLAITAFNHPDTMSEVCDKVNIDIQEGVIKGFLNEDEVKHQLQNAKLYPLGRPMEDISTRQLEEALLQNPFIETAQCYKTQTGHVNIQLTQRLPVIHVIADNGENYYVDEHGSIMSGSRYASDLVVATGSIRRSYAQKTLTRVGYLLLQEPLWRNQVEQLNVLPDGSIEMVPRVGNHVIYLGQPVNLRHKLSRLEKFYRYGLSKAGWNKYSYINLEFGNQIVCTKRVRNK